MSSPRRMSHNMGLTDLTAFVSFGDSLDNEKLSPQISRQPSRISGLATGPTNSMGEGLNRRINDLEMTEKEKLELMHTKTFRKVQADIKDREKRQKINAAKEREMPKLENEQSEQVIYVDKGRQIANVQGKICF